jgi:hypothetical protein
MRAENKHTHTHSFFNFGEHQKESNELAIAIFLERLNRCNARCHENIRKLGMHDSRQAREECENFSIIFVRNLYYLQSASVAVIYVRCAA